MSIVNVATGRAVLLEPLSNMQDSSSLSKHGNVVIMFQGYGANSSPSVKTTWEFAECVKKWLRANKYDPEVDSFVIAGRSTKTAIALAVICMENPHLPVRIMIYDGVENEYVDRTLG